MVDLRLASSSLAGLDFGFEKNSQLASWLLANQVDFEKVGALIGG